MIADPGFGTLEDALASLAPQSRADVTVIVAAFRPRPPGMRGAESVRWLHRPGAALVPELWSAGIAVADRELVALTTSHFVPAPDWVTAIRAARARSGAPAIGGRIEPPAAGSGLLWATYLLRYSAQLLLTEERFVGDVAADNAAYLRSAVASVPEALREGFWEQDLHRRLLAAGSRVCFAPQVRVRLTATLPFWPLARQRLLHGRRFGRARVSGRSRSFRLVALLGSPLVPAILASRIASRALRSRVGRVPLLRALPALGALILAWSLGEALGYARGPLPRRPAAADGGADA